MRTVLKNAPHLQPGDVVVFRSEASGAERLATVASVGPYEKEDLLSKAHRRQGPWTAVRFSYEHQEPDGNGGIKVKTKTTGPVIFRARETVEVVR